MSGERALRVSGGRIYSEPRALGPLKMARAILREEGFRQLYKVNRA